MPNYWISVRRRVVSYSLLNVDAKDANDARAKAESSVKWDHVEVSQKIHVEPESDRQ